MIGFAPIIPMSVFWGAAGAALIANVLAGRRLRRTGRPGAAWAIVGLRGGLSILVLLLLLNPYRIHRKPDPTRFELGLLADISGSMSEVDMTINSEAASRIEVLKVVAEKFIDRRQGDRLGLILFGTNAYTYVPLTFDLETLKKLLLDVTTGLAGRHTAIGDAIGLAIKTMREQKTAHKVLILVTDGSNTAGFENPIVAAQAARQQGLTIYTIGVGTDAESLSRTYGQQNIPTGITLNERVLRLIAEVTRGQYFRATNTLALENIYLALDKLEPIEHQYQAQRPRTELFMMPLVAGFLVILLLITWSIRQSRLAAR